ncbi:DUF1488 family protein [Variovorax sp. GT1P44]|uniref:DUF1488 family protein n=1 Tax=Variovorax sp. GT1P44 TaxID=3443742 RepID=UPI003F473853
MSNPPFFHDASGAVHFWVPIDGQLVGASIGKETLHYCYRPTATDDQPLETYQLHAHEIEAAVRRRVAGGSVEPVMLRDYDLREPAGKSNV